jgi:hypothetical protein
MLEAHFLVPGWSVVVSRAVGFLLRIKTAKCRWPSGHPAKAIAEIKKMLVERQI